MIKVDIKWEIERLRAEMEQEIEAGGLDGICIGDRLYKLSMDTDELINAFLKEQQKISN